MSFISSLAVISDWSKVSSIESEELSGAFRDAEPSNQPKGAADATNKRNSIDSRLDENQMPTTTYDGLGAGFSDKVRLGSVSFVC